MKKHTPLFWANLFGIEFVDIDGWEGSWHFSQPVDITEFLTRTCSSCIHPFDFERYKLLNEMI